MLLLEAVDEGLASLGDSAKHAVYFHLDKKFNIKKEEIPCKVEAFAEALEKIFGPGANLLEILIMKRLYERIGRSFKLHTSQNLQFTEYVAAAKQSFREDKAPSYARETQAMGGNKNTNIMGQVGGENTGLPENSF